MLAEGKSLLYCLLFNTIVQPIVRARIKSSLISEISILMSFSFQVITVIWVVIVITAISFYYIKERMHSQKKARLISAVFSLFYIVINRIFLVLGLLIRQN